MTDASCFHRRILIIDDNRAIHDDFQKILAPVDHHELEQMEAKIFGSEVSGADKVEFQFESAFQGETGVTLAEKAVAQERAFSMAFVDVRMPPGMDGVETAARLWATDPNLHVVLCTAYSDYSWEEITAKIPNRDRLLILKKPFDSLEVIQLAHALTEKWRIESLAREHLDGIEQQVAQRTRDLIAANQKLREQATLLDIANDAILVWDLDGCIHFMNQSAERLYGWEACDAAGHKALEVLDASAAEMEEAGQIVIRDGAWSGELHHHNKEGREITVEGRWTLVRRGEGNPTSILAIHTDVTERNQLKAQLVRAQRMESLGTLAAGIAHDLNNTLSPIAMAIDLLKTQVRDPVGAEVIQTIENSACHGAELVRQVLSFARGVGGERVALQPSYVVQEVAKIVADTFPKDIELSTGVAEDLWNVCGDATQLHQVLLNLCVNARDAISGAGKIAISASNVVLDESYVAMNREAQAGHYVMLVVEDSGCGIPPSVMDIIFDPFFTTKEFGKGTGLGLSTSLGIIKSHGGFIRVNSEEGRGARFEVYVPADLAMMEVVEAPAATELKRGNGEWILVIDDEKPILTVTRHALEAFGYRVLTAQEGADGIALYAQRQSEIAAVLTDMMMPGMDGEATMAILRHINPEVKIIAASGLKTDGNPQGVLAGGTPHFLSKPYTAETLLKLLADVLKAK